MTTSQVRLHRKLYRAGAIDDAIEAAIEIEPNTKIDRNRDGDHHVVTLSGLAREDAENLVLEIADLALRLTVEADQR